MQPLAAVKTVQVQAQYLTLTSEVIAAFSTWNNLLAIPISKWFGIKLQKVIALRKLLSVC